MRKNFTCLSILVCFLTSGQAQDTLQSTQTGSKPDSLLLAGSTAKTFPNAVFIALITTISQKANEQAITGKTQLHTQDEQYVAAFASDHGITSSQAREMIDAWAHADTVKEDDQDGLLQGARHYYLKQFHTSSLYYEQAAAQQEEAISWKLTGSGKPDTALIKTVDEACTIYLLAGNSSNEAGDHARAIRLYRRADSLLTLCGHPETMQDPLAQKKDHLSDLLTAALYEEGNKLGGEKGMILLTQAAIIEQAAIARTNQATSPQEWARKQSHLGTLLQAQAALADESAGDSLYLQAITAYNAALGVCTRKALPQEWAGIQNNMGVILSKLGAIEEAIATFRSALEIYNQQEHPQDWALTQYNLGNMLQFQGSEKKDTAAMDLFKQSAAAYQLSLQVYTQQQTPEEWAWAQHKLGMSLFSQGRLTEGKELLTQAVTAFQAALAVRTRDCFPEEWASTQYNLGTALWEESSRTAGNNVPLLEKAIKAYDSALEFYTKKAYPEQWFNTQNGLGLLYEQKQQWELAILHFETLRDMEPMYAAQKVNELRRKAGK